MQVSVKLLSNNISAAAQAEWRLSPGRAARVGRASDADFVVAEDSYLSSIHFALECDGQRCDLRDLNSRNGVFVNGVRINEAVLQDDDRIKAGNSEFIVSIKQVADENALPALSAPQSIVTAATLKNLSQCLRDEPQPLYALLDAAREPRVLQFLNEAKEEWQSLYSGISRIELAAFAPYLVRLSAPSPFFETLLRECWGASCGVYLTWGESFDQVRKHFRRFLMVQMEDGQEAYFRFYDPRVMRTFLLTCTAEESKDFFGSVGSYLMEAEQPDLLLKFTLGADGAQCQKISVGADEAV